MLPTFSLRYSEICSIHKMRRIAFVNFNDWKSAANTMCHLQDEQSAMSIKYPDHALKATYSTPIAIS